MGQDGDVGGNHAVLANMKPARPGPVEEGARMDACSAAYVQPPYSACNAQLAPADKARGKRPLFVGSTDADVESPNMAPRGRAQP